MCSFITHCKIKGFRAPSIPHITLFEVTCRKVGGTVTFDNGEERCQYGVEENIEGGLDDENWKYGLTECWRYGAEACAEWYEPTGGCGET